MTLPISEVIPYRRSKSKPFSVSRFVVTKECSIKKE